MLPFASCSPYNPSLSFSGLAVTERSIVFAIRSRKLAAYEGAGQRIQFLFIEHILKGEHTGLVNHRQPPSSNQPRWPPHEVVNKTPYGVCLNSSYGIACLTEIYRFELIICHEICTYRMKSTDRIIFRIYGQEWDTYC